MATRAPLVTLALVVALTNGCDSRQPSHANTPSGRDSVAQEPVGSSADTCGPDLITLYIERDPETVALYQRSTAEFGAKARERTLCLAENGDADAQVSMGVDLRDGAEFLPQDYAQATYWFRRAAAQGDPMAMFNLGRFHQEGRGVAQDLVRAHMWFNLAVSAFDWNEETRSWAYRSRDRIETLLTPEQLKEAQRLASEWKPTPER